MEKWKKIKDYENYEISNYGKVKSIERITSDGRKIKEKFLNPYTDWNGYLKVRLYNCDGSKKFFVHRLVAMAFIPNLNNYNQINHKDENKKNNFAKNLEWCDSKYNMNYDNTQLKKAQPLMKPVIQLTKNNVIIKEWNSIKEASLNTLINSSNITTCCKVNRKTAGGFIWKYAKESD